MYWSIVVAVLTLIGGLDIRPRLSVAGLSLGLDPARDRGERAFHGRHGGLFLVGRGGASVLS